MEEIMFKIGEFSKLANLTVRTLHHYEDMELLLPTKIDSVTNYRYYSVQQIEEVNRIRMLQQIGLSLKDIKVIIQTNDMKLLEHYYELREVEINQEIESLKRKQNIIKMLKDSINDESNIEKYNVLVKEIPQRRVMSIRKIIASYDDEHEMWTALHEEFLKQNVKMDNPPAGMTIYHDRVYKESGIDIEVQSNIVGDYENTDDVVFYEAAGFTMASVTFNGSYDQMQDVTQALAFWIEANDYVICGPMINIPHISPAQDSNPDNWITEAGIIIKKA